MRPDLGAVGLEPAADFGAAAFSAVAAAGLASSFFASPAASSVFLAPSVLSSAFFASSFGVDRLSVMYHPDPLKTTPTGWITRRIAAPHSGHSRSGSSAKRWTASNWWPQLSQR